jgi:hypothetical protein
MRLNFSYACPERIREGIARLGRVLHTAIYEPLSAIEQPEMVADG